MTADPTPPRDGTAAPSVGRALPHDAARLHVTGQARYVDDIPLPAGALHLAFGLSDIAAGRLVALDLVPVRAVPGVVGAWSAADLGVNPDCSPSAHDEPLLSDGQVHYAGQPLFLVAATSHVAARAAARRAQVTTEATTPILTIDDALAAGTREGQAGDGRGGVDRRRRPCRRKAATWSSTLPPSTRPRSSTRSPTRCTCPCTPCGWRRAAWAAASAARKARATRLPSPARSWPPARAAR